MLPRSMDKPGDQTRSWRLRAKVERVVRAGRCFGTGQAGRPNARNVMPSGRMNRARPSRHDDPSGPSTLDDRNREAGAARQRWSKGHRGGKLILRDRPRPGDRPKGGLPPAGTLRTACRPGWPTGGVRRALTRTRSPLPLPARAEHAADMKARAAPCGEREVESPATRGLAETPAPFPFGGSFLRLMHYKLVRRFGYRNGCVTYDCYAPASC